MRKVAFITGGASGLGEYLSLGFAKDGYDLVITYNNSKNGAEKLKNIINDKYKVDVLILKCDLASEEMICESVDEAIEYFKKIDVLVNNAAVEYNLEFCDKTKEMFMHTLEINLVGTFLISRKIAEEMYKNKYGKIINISSNNAFDKYDPITLEYDASKAALISMTHNFAKQYAPYINVNAIAPGWIMTDKILNLDDSLDNNFISSESRNILLNRFGTIDDIVNLVLFLASDKSSYINSEVIRIDGGSY